MFPDELGGILPNANIVYTNTIFYRAVFPKRNKAICYTHNSSSFLNLERFKAY